MGLNVIEIALTGSLTKYYLYISKVRSISVIDHSRRLPLPARGCRVSPSSLSYGGYLESLRAVELEICCNILKKKWVDFSEIHRTVGHSQTRLFISAGCLTYPLSKPFPPVCRGCWVGFFRVGRVLMRWGSWRLCAALRLRKRFTYWKKNYHSKADFFYKH